MTATGVVIAGAGPVGLMLACELRTANVPVVIVERLAVPMTESRASQLTTLTAELLHERGFDELLGDAVHEPRAHYGGVSFTLSDLDSDYAGNWKVPQYVTERALGQRAEQLGAVLLRGYELAWVQESSDHLSCGASGPSGEVRLRARYLAGCDGAASTVREVCGFTAERTDPTRELLRADVTGIDIPERRFELLDKGFAVASASRDVTRVMVHAFGMAPRKRAAPPGFGEVARMWATVTGEDISGGTATWVDSFDNASGLVGCYRRGRVFLAGDAAHWQLPIGGQAINVGLQDAVNLGWKLAGAVHGWASPHVLDSYDSERRPIAAGVLSQVAAQETVLLGGREAGALRSVLAELLDCALVRGQLARVVSGLADSYGQAGGHPPGGRLAGRRLPRVPLLTDAGPVTTAELISGGRAAAILRIVSPGGRGERRRDAVLSRPGGLQLRSIHLTPERAHAFDGISSIVIRPDGYVAWAGDDEAGLLASADYWFGAGSGRQASLAEPSGQR